MVLCDGIAGIGTDTEEENCDDNTDNENVGKRKALGSAGHDRAKAKDRGANDTQASRARIARRTMKIEI